VVSEIGTIMMGTAAVPALVIANRRANVKPPPSSPEGDQSFRFGIRR